MNDGESKEDAMKRELAEETGLHIGDGTMNFYNNQGKLKGSYALRGHINDDKEHYNNIINKLYLNLYNLNFQLYVVLFRFQIYYPY